MHLQFVEPSKRYADIIIPEGGFNEVGIDLITGKIKSFLARSPEDGALHVSDESSRSGRPEYPS